jgi:hypothetical protein
MTLILICNGIINNLNLSDNKDEANAFAGNYLKGPVATDNPQNYCNNSYNQQYVYQSAGLKADKSYCPANDEYNRKYVE